MEELFAEHREKFGSGRRDGARKIAEESGGLFALRRLRVGAVGLGSANGAGIAS